MTKDERDINEHWLVEFQYKRTIAKRERDELREEIRDAEDLCDDELAKALRKEHHELNLDILRYNKLIRELEAELA